MTPTISRRSCLAGIACLASGSTLLSGCATTQGKSKDYVLIHGAWHGSWAWDAVKPLLEKPGTRVLAPTLKGLAERQDENGPNVTLETHIAEVVALLDSEHLNNIVLVGHSYAGFVVTGVCDRRPERIAHVVYLDAFVPESGQKVYDYVKPAERVQQMRADTRNRGQGYRSFPPPAANWGLSGELMDYVNKRMTPHPAMTNEEPILLTRGGPCAVPRRTYIDCTQPAMPPFIETKARIKKDARWNYLSVSAGHEVSLTHPQLVADLLTNLS
ncbi:alpha/beta fold hydrolase [Piscinibacter sp.]|uniref:alpha/beta fold hydrolase n=1 Tax=Piscinibacter sp. TaxID=1903157 RepID=UPI002C6F26E6|nr:alpha/beta hydrolase [Albitalea sp.]HUG26298.1 alpha/beta hydrolase [Albitalea sp.]